MATELKLLLERFLTQVPSDSTDWRMKIIMQWHELVGPIARYALVEKIDGDTLVIAVASSVWMQELYAMSPILLKRVNQLAGGCYVARVRFKHQQPSPLCKQIVNQQKINGRAYGVNLPVKQRGLTSGESVALKKVADRELSQALECFLMRCHQVNGV